MIRQLITHTAAYTFANIVSRGTILVWLIVLPAFLSTADYGALGLIMTTAALVTMLVPLEVSQGLARYYSTAPQDERPGWSRTAWTFTTIMLTVAAAAGMFLAPWLNRLLLGQPRYLPEFRIAIVYFALNSSFVLLQNQFRWDFRARDYTLTTLLFSVTTLALSVGLAALLPDALEGVLVGLVIGAAAGVAVGTWRLRGTIGFQLDRAKLARMLRFSLPLVPAGVALFVSTYASRFILNDLLNLTDVGLFTWASQVANIPPLLLLGVQGAVTPLVMKHHADAGTPALLARSFETIVAGELCLCLAAGLLTPELIRLLGYSAFAGAGPLVMILAPAYLMLQLYVFSPGFAVAERTSLQLLVSIIAGASAIALNYLLIGRAGLPGAAFATLGSSAIFLGLWFTLSNPLYPIPVRWGRLGLLVALFAVCAGLSRILPAGAIAEALIVKLVLIALLGGAALTLGFAHAGQFRLLLAQLRPGNLQLDPVTGRSE